MDDRKGIWIVKSLLQLSQEFFCGVLGPGQKASKQKQEVVVASASETS